MARSASLGVLLDHAQDKIVLLDEAGRFTYLNDAVERILGYEPDELIGENAFELIHPDDVDDAWTAFEETIESTTFTERTANYRIRAKDGEWVWLESRMSNLTDEQLDGYVVSSRDVTDRVEAQRERQETATRLQELAATTSDVLWMFNGDWSELLFINPAFEELYGQPIAELEADPERFLDTIHPDDVPAVKDGMASLAAGESVDMEYRVNPEKDYNVWVWAQGEPIIEDGEVVRITGFSRDVTDRRRRERQLYVMDNLLRHNLRNDLSVILGNAELIEKQAPEVDEQTAVIRRTGEELLASAEKERDIIDLLTTDVCPERLDLVAAVRRGVGTIEDRFPSAQIDVTGPDTAPVFALEELHLVVVELLENAIRHSDTDPVSVSVAVQLEAEQVALIIEDEAPPFPDIEANVLTGDHEMNDIYHSSGLGLWLVYWIVELSDGSIRVETSPTDGNRIEARFPTPTD
ncbi:MAG: PAS domain-containing sensor histidine kinase [Halobacteriales archaeon]|nr:PAS domain-containing sensor histidine kinase [Halobacteriales archaeon]